LARGVGFEFFGGYKRFAGFGGRDRFCAFDGLEVLLLVAVLLLLVA